MTSSLVEGLWWLSLCADQRSSSLTWYTWLSPFPWWRFSLFPHHSWLQLYTWAILFLLCSLWIPWHLGFIIHTAWSAFFPAFALPTAPHCEDSAQVSPPPGSLHWLSVWVRSLLLATSAPCASLSHFPDHTKCHPLPRGDNYESILVRGKLCLSAQTQRMDIHWHFWKEPQGKEFWKPDKIAGMGGTGKGTN